jgi:hypothetical protein
MPNLKYELIDVMLLFLTTDLYDSTEKTYLHNRLHTCLASEPNNRLLLFLITALENKIKNMNMLADYLADNLSQIPIDIIKIMTSFLSDEFDDGILLEPFENVLGFNYAFYVYCDKYTGYIKVIVRTEHIGLTHTEWFKHFSYCNEYYYETLQLVSYNYKYEIIDRDTIAELETKISK